LQKSPAHHNFVDADHNFVGA
jgi:hypothetical protein